MSARPGIALLPFCALMLALPAAGVRAQLAVDRSTAGAYLPTTPAGSAEVVPTMRSLAVGAQRQPAALPSMNDVSTAPRGAGLGQSEALMIVGGAAILVGAIIGDDPGRVIMIGGAIVGLVGLYKYLQ